MSEALNYRRFFKVLSTLGVSAAFASLVDPFSFRF